MELMKINLQKTNRNYYTAKKTPEKIHLDTCQYLTVSGQSAPEDESFHLGIESIYSVAYSIKFLNKGEDNDFVVPKMEAYWYVDGGPEVQHLFSQTPRKQWMWKIAIRMPDIVGKSHYAQALKSLWSKKGEDKSNVKFEAMEKGIFAQILHVGSYEAETEPIKKLHDFITSIGHEISGYHQEIYLNDPRRTAEENLKTILRYRIRPKQ